MLKHLKKPCESLNLNREKKNRIGLDSDSRKNYQIGLDWTQKIFGSYLDSISRVQKTLDWIWIWQSPIHLHPYPKILLFHFFALFYIKWAKKYTPKSLKVTLHKLLCIQQCTTPPILFYYFTFILGMGIKEKWLLCTCMKSCCSFWNYSHKKWKRMRTSKKRFLLSTTNDNES